MYADDRKVDTVFQTDSQNGPKRLVGVLIPNSTPFVLPFIHSNVKRETDYISDTGKPREVPGRIELHSL
eukprot:COSAG02_NODE_57535_length_280_cov_0.790055_1_plen_68_part_10